MFALNSKSIGCLCPLLLQMKSLDFWVVEGLQEQTPLRLCSSKSLKNPVSFKHVNESTQEFSVLLFGAHVHKEFSTLKWLSKQKVLGPISIPSWCQKSTWLSGQVQKEVFGQLNNLSQEVWITVCLFQWDNEGIQPPREAISLHFHTACQ